MAGIDNDYWIEFGKERITKAIESREKAAEKLDTFLLWIWGIYTSLFALASFFDFLSGDLKQLLFAGQPILIIIISRFFCLLVSMPTSVNADPAVAQEIISGFQEIVIKRKKRLSIAVSFTFVSILSLFIALVGYNYYDPNKNVKLGLQRAKLEKELNEKRVVAPDPTLATIDSLKKINELQDLKFQYEFRKRKLEYLKANDFEGFNNLNKINP